MLTQKASYQVRAIAPAPHRRPAIDGIPASGGRLAVGACQACRQLGRCIPRSVKIVGFSNLESVSLFDPPLIPITQPAHDIGRAARILLQAVEKRCPVSAKAWC